MTALEFTLLVEEEQLAYNLNMLEQNFAMEFTNTTEVSLTANYEVLSNKPKINSVELLGNKTFEDLGANALSNMEIEQLLK